MDQTEWRLQAEITDKPVLLHFTAQTFSILPLCANGKPGQKPTLSTAVRNVVWVSLSTKDAGVLTLSTLAKKSRRHVLVNLSAKCEAPTTETQEWIDKLMETAYDGVALRRKLKIFVNPMGGKGQAETLFESVVKPILEAAQCSLDVDRTTHRYHAKEIASSMSLEFDAVAVLSGDGLPHEILNGFASRTDSLRALRIPIVPIPTGSANGLNVNLHGPKLGFDIGLAVLNVIKGKPMEIDLCSITQGDVRTWSFMSQAFGLMAEIDLGTEHLRWMGDTRFILGYLRGIVQTKPCPIRLRIKAVQSDKRELLKSLASKTLQKPPLVLQTSQESQATEGLPADRYAKEEDGADGWVTFEKPILFLYGGLVPYVAKDLLQFPMAQPSDGFLDLVVQEITTRTTLLTGISNAENGATFFVKSQNYFKALAYAVELTSSSGVIAIDGESYPWEPMYVEVHSGLARTLSPHGHYVSTFVPKDSS